MQAYIRDPAAPTMADSGVLANVAIHEGGHAQGTLGQASRLRDLVRSMTPTKILGEVTIGGVFGGGRLFVGEGEQQDSLKVVALTPLRVAAVPAEQLALEAPGNVVEELRNYIAFQMTYWLSRCNMISKHVRHFGLQGYPLHQCQGSSRFRVTADWISPHLTYPVGAAHNSIDFLV